MRVQLPAPCITIDASERRVASYADLRGAAMAVDHLRRRGFDVARIAVRPGAMRPIPAALTVGADQRRRRLPVLGGAIALAGFLFVIGAGGGALLTAPLVGLVGAGVFYGLAELLRSVRRRRSEHAASLVAVDRWEVVCEPGAAADAEHELARWWDPAARPAPGSPPTAEARRLRVVAAA